MKYYWQNCGILGVCGFSHDWFYSYLSGRAQCVQVGGCLSDPLLIIHGIPQRSMIGVILFKYILMICIREGIMVSTTFVDDMKYGTALT